MMRPGLVVRAKEYDTTFPRGSGVSRRMAPKGLDGVEVMKTLSHPPRIVILVARNFWNCGDEGHTVKDYFKPCDKDAFQKSWREFRESDKKAVRWFCEVEKVSAPSSYQNLF